MQRSIPKKSFFLTLLAISAAILISCAHMAPEENTSPDITVPDSYSLYGEAAPAPDRWWEEFGSDELNRLIDEALDGSLTLKQSIARLAQSRALAVQAGAERLPDLRLTAGASESRKSLGGPAVTDSSRSLTLASSYELDLWDRVHSRERSALLEVEASRENLYASMVTLASEVTLGWLEGISVRSQLQLVAEQLKTNRTLLDLIELRFTKGAATALDVYQQRQAVAEIKAASPLLEARLQVLLHKIAVLAGKPPASQRGIVSDTFPDVGPLPNAGFPADLLSNRPDVRAAGLKLRAAEKQVQAARAGRLPAVNMTATAGFSSGGLGDLLDNWLTTLAANLTVPLFNAGEKKAEVARQRAIVDERLAAYRQTVLTAIREVEDAMIEERKREDYIEALREQISIARDAYREALFRYRKGISDFLPVLSALTGSQRLERSLVQARFEKFSRRVQLHRALGGKWMEKLVE